MQRRLRALPSRVVVYLLLAAGLFAELGYGQVWARMTAGAGRAGRGQSGPERVGRGPTSDRRSAAACAVRPCPRPGHRPEPDRGVLHQPNPDTGYIDSGEQQGARPAVDGRGLVVPGYEGGFFIGPSVLDNVTTQMDLYRDEVFGPVLAVLRVDTLDEAISLVNDNPYGNGTAIFTSSGEAARRFQRGVTVGMVGVNVPIPVPMAYYSFGGWKSSLFGDSHVHGPEGVHFYTRAKVVTARWPAVTAPVSASYHFPTSS